MFVLLAAVVLLAARNPAKAEGARAEVALEATAAEPEVVVVDLADLDSVRDAAAAVPDALVDELALVGPPDRIQDRLAAWKDSGATTLLISTRDSATLRVVSEALS